MEGLRARIDAALAGTLHEEKALTCFEIQKHGCSDVYSQASLFCRSHRRPGGPRRLNFISRWLTSQENMLPVALPFDARTVLSSKYATLFGLPVALFGALGYFTAFSLATLAAFDYARVARFLAITVTAMFLGTLWLLSVQAFILHAYCTWCLLSAACTFLLAGLLLAVPPRR